MNFISIPSLFLFVATHEHLARGREVGRVAVDGQQQIAKLGNQGRQRGLIDAPKGPVID